MGRLVYYFLGTQDDLIRRGFTEKQSGFFSYFVRGRIAIDKETKRIGIGYAAEEVAPFIADLLEDHLVRLEKDTTI